MDDQDFVGKDVCYERHKGIDREIVDIKESVTSIKDKQEEYNRTIKNIYYALLIIAASTILTLAGVILGRAIDLHLPL